MAGHDADIVINGQRLRASLISNQLTRAGTLSWTIEYGADRNGERDGHPQTI